MPTESADAPLDRDEEQGAATATDPYSASRIGRGVFHLVGGKAVTSVAGVGTFFLLVRELPVEQFAAYTILFGLVELIEAVTGIGLTQILSRYLPELFVAHRTPTMQRLAACVLALRFCVLGIFLGLAYFLTPMIAPLTGLGSWEWALKTYLAVVLVRVVATTLFGVLESMLYQAVAQLGFGSVTVLRFALIFYASSRGQLDIGTVILIELVTDFIGVGIMSIGLVRALARGAGGARNDEPGWIGANLRRMLGFGIKGYLQHMLIMPFGSSTNRLLVGGALSAPEVALFGFAQSIADLMERYLPLKLLAGVIRPVLTARFVRDRRFANLELSANLIFKFNAILVCLAAVVIAAGGKEMLAFVSAGKYSENAVGLLLLMCLLVLLFSLRQMLDHVSHAVERNGPLIWSNTLITFSVLPGIALLPILGVFALPTANVCGLAAGCLILIWRLRAEGFHYRQEWASLGKMLASTIVGMLAGVLTRWLGAGWVASATVGASCFMLAVAVFRPWDARERLLIKDFTSRLRQRTPDRRSDALDSVRR